MPFGHYNVVWNERCVRDNSSTSVPGTGYRVTLATAQPTRSGSTARGPVARTTGERVTGVSGARVRRLIKRSRGQTPPGGVACASQPPDARQTNSLGDALVGLRLRTGSQDCRYYRIPVKAN
ncbi:hypothetical protein DPEC_G00288680 [Dallia pectoralis]|uniref:Uncharacterized protein n=1 Tax=Dallia pectoralis TaxID=75939 RepID=A0ACC2FKN6_DALPE|nr:hypothetical protein DPEC_G00288680 [Dallia pectoralis]